MPEENNTDWEQIWNARQSALASVLGNPSNTVFHAPVPFHLGGVADVIWFPNYVPGATYVTAEMTGEDVGQRQSTLGNYELMICTQQELPKAADLVSTLARYT